MGSSMNETALAVFLRDLPHNHDYRFQKRSDALLRKTLFKSLIGNNALDLPLLFPHGPPQDEHLPERAWSLREAQGAVEGAEYTAAARGHPCGHIFRNGESTYHCKTCAADDTCVLCARCFTESDHEGHTVFISVSPGNSGCCDCADDEAWVRPVHCTIHRASDASEDKAAGKATQGPGLPDEIVELIKMTIGRALDYVCDVFSCSPEQLRLPKTEVSVKRDELLSALNPEKYEGPEPIQQPVEYSLVLWNDEKHTVDNVLEQIAKACRKSKGYGRQKALEVDEVGRSVVHISDDLPAVLQMAKILEHIRVSVTVRSSRDTFREQMCATIIDWLADISGCSMGNDPHILRNIICSEMLGIWQVGSQKINAEVGQAGIFDHEYDDTIQTRQTYRFIRTRATNATNLLAVLTAEGEDLNMDDDDMNEDEDDEDEDGEEEEVDEEERANLTGRPRTDGMTDTMDIEDEDGNVVVFPREDDMDVEMDEDTEDNANEVLEATLAGYPPPPPPPPAGGPLLAVDRSRQASVADSQSATVLTPQESDDGESAQPTTREGKIPKTPRHHHKRQRKPRPPNHWLERPKESIDQSQQPLAENLGERIRLDRLILYDLRLWKILRVNLRHLYISTVVTVPEFKRILGLRFAGLYTVLSQLYLIADREPDHSIINLSVQLLTTPSITAEVVDRANFLTNLMAILYTFLTTRQVGYPKDVSPTATLAFDAGAVTNRRMFHFFIDVRYMFQSSFVQEKIRAEPRYLIQFLDLVKLLQGVCPNVRAVGEHVEYETDAWISASMIIKEINRLCRLVADTYLSIADEDPSILDKIMPAIKTVGQRTTVSSLGLEWKRFSGSEFKREVQFKQIGGLISQSVLITIPDVRVVNEPMSFHHPLHYLLSWLLQAGKSMDWRQAQQLLLMDIAEFKALDTQLSSSPERGPFAPFVGPEDRLAALFDVPLRVCAWLSQMRAMMWVRNGMTLRHQMHTYRGTSQRDVSYQRDLFMLQAGLVICRFGNDAPGERFLAQMIDRYDLTDWVMGNFAISSGYEENQQIDVIEDFFHLLVVLFTERDDLVIGLKSNEIQKRAIQRDIAHVLCFEPLSFSDLSGRLTDKVGDADGFDEVLGEMTKYRAPEGLNDSGTFELRPEYMETIDPYYAFYSRNQREEAESVYKAHMAKKTGKEANEIVPEPRLSPVRGGLFHDLTAFTGTDLFARLLSSTLTFALKGRGASSTIAISRIESLLQILLHLVLLAVSEDRFDDQQPSISSVSIVWRMLVTTDSTDSPMQLLQSLLGDEQFPACHPRIRLVMKRIQEKAPQLFLQANIQTSVQNPSQARIDTETKDAKKRAALERQARVMAQFKDQQSSFMNKQGLDWDVDDFSENEDKEMGDFASQTSSQKTRPYPSEPCMLCQEETNDQRLFGCFAFVTNSRILRQTPLHDPEYVSEILQVPQSLDRSAEAIRPFGAAAKNKQRVRKASVHGSVVDQEVQGLSKGYHSESVPAKSDQEGPVMTSCGHITHFSCFEAYEQSTSRRHSQQIARNHPERLEQREFLCPLCKALGNMFLPIIWKGKKESYPGMLDRSQDRFDHWLATTGIPRFPEKPDIQGLQDQYINETFNTILATSVERATISTNRSPSPPSQSSSTSRPGAIGSLSSLLSMTRRSIGQSPTEGNVHESTSPADELLRAYTRLQDSVAVNHIAKVPVLSGNVPELQNYPALCHILGYSIAAAEIASRGVEGFPTGLSSVPDQTLTTLRIYAETVASYMAIGHVRDTKASVHTWKDILENHLRCLYTMDYRGPRLRKDTLFTRDIFSFLTQSSLVLPELWRAEDGGGYRTLRLCYLAEILKVVTTYLEFWIQNPLALSDMRRGQSDSLDPDIRNLVHFSLHELARVSSTARQGLPPAGYSISDFEAAATTILQCVIKRYALVFLRKSLILMHVQSGIDFSAAESLIDPSATELDRLSTVLVLPSLQDLLIHFSSDADSARVLRTYASRWIRDVYQLPPDDQTLSIAHPAIFELVGLPRTYDALSEEAVKRRCPTTGKEMTDPAVCLFCGSIFCSQATCCENSEHMGGCNQHMRTCGGNVGLFISIRKCMVVFLHNGHGSWAHAPYLDKHGEVDPTLRRHHQLFLNQKRYDRLLRDVWLGHGIPSAISRRLEGDINTGGWETL